MNANREAKDLLSRAVSFTKAADAAAKGVK